jgi:hypothetical protein
VVTREFRMAGLGNFGMRIFIGLTFFPLCLAALWFGVRDGNWTLIVPGLLFGVPTGLLLCQYLLLSGEPRLTFDAQGFVLHGVFRDKAVPWKDIKRVSVSSLGDDTSETCTISRYSRHRALSFTLSDLHEPAVALHHLEAAQARAALI